MKAWKKKKLDTLFQVFHQGYRYYQLLQVSETNKVPINIHIYKYMNVNRNFVFLDHKY